MTIRAETTLRVCPKAERGNRRRGRASRNGFSLLEVILALAILTGAIAVLGELGRLGMENARIARDMTQAQLLCESKLAEITAGITPPESVRDAPFDTVVGDGQIEWVYSIETDYTDLEGLIAVRVTVRQNLPEEKRPIEFPLHRWILDPGVEVSAATTGEPSGSAGSDMGGSSE